MGAAAGSEKSKNTLLKRMYRDRQYYLLLIPGFLLTFIFKYLPMGGLVIAFQEFNIFKGILNSPWTGLENFREVFSSHDFTRVFRNTLLISLYKLFAGFPIPIVLSLMLNELKNRIFKRSVQTIIYLPHFISWVIISGMMLSFFSPVTGAINTVRDFFGMARMTENFLTKANTFRGFLVVTEIWKECGWNTIIYLAAISTVDQSLYDAAKVDGAKKLRQILHVTLPCVSGVIVILLILSIGFMMDAGFDQIMALQNDLVRDVSDIFDTFTFRKGISGGRYSYTTAVSMFKSIISLILILGADRFAKLIGEEGLI